MLRLLKLIASKCSETFSWIKEALSDTDNKASSKRLAVAILLIRVYYGGLSDFQFQCVCLLIAACLSITMAEPGRWLGPTPKRPPAE